MGKTGETCASGSPALMYLTWPATHTTKLPSGRPSTSCLRLRSYSEAGIPGVTSPCLTVRAYCCQRTIFSIKMNHTPAPTVAAGGERRRAAHRDGGGISRWVGQRRRVSWLVDDAGALAHEPGWYMMRPVHRIVNLDGKSEERGEIERSKVAARE